MGGAPVKDRHDGPPKILDGYGKGKYITWDGGAVKGLGKKEQKKSLPRRAGGGRMFEMLYQLASTPVI